MAELPSVGFEDMPDEIILQIFKHLGFYDNAASAQVCKRWKLLSEDQFLWQKINLAGRKVPAKFIEKALNHGCQYLNLLGTKIESVPGPDSFSVKNQLKYLSISCYDEHENLLGATELLEKLSIEPAWGHYQFYQSNIILDYIIQNKHTLTVLRIQGIPLSFERVKSIFTNCLELTEVNLEVRII